MVQAINIFCTKRKSLGGRGEKFLLAVVKLLVSLRARKQHIDPDGHGLRRGRHQKVGPVKRLHAEGQFRAGALDRLQVVSVNLLNGLETDWPLQLQLGLVREIENLAEGVDEGDRGWMNASGGGKYGDENNNADGSVECWRY